MVDGDNVPGKRPDLLAVAGSQTGHDAPRSDVSAEDLEAGWQSWVMPYLEDSALGPVLIVIVIHVVAFKLLRADIAHNGRLGKISWLLISTWLLSFIAAYASVMTGLF